MMAGRSDGHRDLQTCWVPMRHRGTHLPSPAPARPTVDLWVATASADLANAWRYVVPAADLAVLSRYRAAESDRRTVQLALRRSVIAQRLDQPLAAVAIGVARNGAIRVAGTNLVVSASHHDDVTVLALAEGAWALGVDVEPLDDPEWDDALEDVLTAREVQAHAALPASEQRGAYFTSWTLKEAVMKALGQGLSDRDPKSIEVALPPSVPSLLALDDVSAPAGWALATVALGRHVCSLALAGADAVSVALRWWPVDLDGIFK